MKYPKNSLQFKRKLIAKVKEYPNVWLREGINHEDWEKVQSEMNEEHTLAFFKLVWGSLRAIYFRKIFIRTIERNFEAPKWPLFHDMSFLYDYVKERIQNKLGGISPPLFRAIIDSKTTPGKKCPCCVYSPIVTKVALECKVSSTDNGEVARVENNSVEKENLCSETLGSNNIQENSEIKSEDLIYQEESQENVPSNFGNESFGFNQQNDVTDNVFPQHREHDNYTGILPVRQQDSPGTTDRENNPPNSLTIYRVPRVIELESNPSLPCEIPAKEKPVEEVIELIDDDDAVPSNITETRLRRLAPKPVTFPQSYITITPIQNIAQILPNQSIAQILPNQSIAQILPNQTSSGVIAGINQTTPETAEWLSVASSILAKHPSTSLTNQKAPEVTELVNNQNIIPRPPSEELAKEKPVSEVIELLDDDGIINEPPNSIQTPIDISSLNAAGVTVSNSQQTYNLENFTAVALVKTSHGFQLLPVNNNENPNYYPQELLSSLRKRKNSSSPVTPESVVAVNKNSLPTESVTCFTEIETNDSNTLQLFNPRQVDLALEWALERTKLIEAVKLNPNAYTAPRNRSAWEKISKELGGGVIHNLKVRWRKIKSRYLKELIAETFQNVKSDWEHYDQMEFYRPHMQRDLDEVRKTREKVQKVVSEQKEKEQYRISSDHISPHHTPKTNQGLEKASVKSIRDYSKIPPKTSSVEKPAIFDPSSMPILQNRPIKITAVQAIPSLDLTDDDVQDETGPSKVIDAMPPAKKTRLSTESKENTLNEPSKQPLVISSVQTGLILNPAELQNKSATTLAKKKTSQYPTPTKMYPPLDLTLDEDDEDENLKTSESISRAESTKSTSRYQEAFVNAFADTKKVYEKFDINSAKSKEVSETVKNGGLENTVTDDDNVICLDDNNSMDSYEEVYVYIEEEEKNDVEMINK